MEFSHCYNAYFHWCMKMHQWKAQGFWENCPKPLRLNKAETLESLGVQGVRLCSVRIIIAEPPLPVAVKRDAELRFPTFFCTGRASSHSAA